MLLLIFQLGVIGLLTPTGAVFNLLCDDRDDKIMAKIERHFNTEVPEVCSLINMFLVLWWSWSLDNSRRKKIYRILVPNFNQTGGNNNVNVIVSRCM